MSGRVCIRLSILLYCNHKFVVVWTALSWKLAGKSRISFIRVLPTIFGRRNFYRPFSKLPASFYGMHPYQKYRIRPRIWRCLPGRCNSFSGFWFSFPSRVPPVCSIHLATAHAHLSPPTNKYRFHKNILMWRVSPNTIPTNIGARAPHIFIVFINQKIIPLKFIAHTHTYTKVS